MIADNTNGPLSRVLRTSSALVVGLYAWLTTASFGAVVLDILYARLAPESRSAFAEVADLLLLITAVTILAALGAIGLSWNSNGARSCVIASLVVVVSGFSVPVLFSPYLGAGSSLGAALRLGISGVASLLALVAFYKLRRNE